MKKENDILAAAMAVARRGGLDAIRTAAVASAAGCQHPLIFYHFDTLENLRDIVATEALRRNDKVIIARLILDKNPHVQHLSKAKRRQYLSALA